MISGFGSWVYWALALVVLAALGVIFYDGVSNMVGSWSQEEYSHAYLIPVLSGLMIWRKREVLAATEVRGAWIGVVVVVVGVVAALFGELSTIYTVIQYGFLLTLYGLVLTWIGWRGIREIWAPLLYLVFIVPLPGFLYQGLSGELQLISSELGVWFVRLFGVSVFLEGNVIDLGIYKLQVVEACSGLRYLFPLTSFAFLCAYLYRGSWWQKGLVFVSAVPVTILLNSLRIGVIGVLVEHWGIEMAEGFLHFFEGWIIFLAGVGFLFGLMWVLARLSGRRGGLQDLVRLELLWPMGSGEGAAVASGQGVSRRGASGQGVSRSVAAAVGFVAVGAVAMSTVPARSEVVPEWKSFATFPMRLGAWQGRDQVLEQQYLDVLKLDDYVLANYRRPGDGAPVNFYLAYYGSQRKGASVHSPRSCIPGGGWEIGAFVPVAVDGVAVGGRPLEVNRVVIAKGSSRQLVYYWFDQRGRQMTNEYGVKWMIFWDALTRNRTDGALVRLVTPVGPGEDLGRAERRLGDFLKEAYPEISAYVPG